MYDENYNHFTFWEGQYGHPACIVTEVVEQSQIHLMRAIFMLHKYLRMEFQYYRSVVKAPPREILPSFGGPLPFAHFGEILATQQIICEHLYEPFYIPNMTLPHSSTIPKPLPPPVEAGKQEKKSTAEKSGM